MLCGFECGMLVPDAANARGSCCGEEGEAGREGGLSVSAAGLGSTRRHDGDDGGGGKE